MAKKQPKPDESMRRTFISGLHLRCAVDLYMRAKELEKGGNAAPLDKENYQSSVIGAVWFSVAFMETAINELYEVASDDAPMSTGFGYFLPRERTSLTLADARVLKSAWLTGRAERLSTLEKYQLALGLLDEPLFDTTSEPYFSAETLKKFRDSLTHYKPEWTPMDGDPTRGGVRGRLKGRFELHPGAGIRDMKYPMIFLSADCARWSIETSRTFTEDFFKRIGVSRMFGPVITTNIHAKKRNNRAVPATSRE